MTDDLSVKHADAISHASTKTQEAAERLNLTTVTGEDVERARENLESALETLEKVE